MGLLTAEEARRRLEAIAGAHGVTWQGAEPGHFTGTEEGAHISPFAVSETMALAEAVDAWFAALEAFLAVADEVREIAERLHVLVFDDAEGLFEAKPELISEGIERLRVLTDPAYTECTYGPEEPHSSMDLGGGLSVEGHWKRSPENDAAIADVVRAAAEVVVQRMTLSFGGQPYYCLRCTSAVFQSLGPVEGTPRTRYRCLRCGDTFEAEPNGSLQVPRIEDDKLVVMTPGAATGGRCSSCRQRSHCVLPKGTPDCGAFAPDRRDASTPAVPPDGTERRRLVALTIAGILDYAPEAD